MAKKVIEIEWLDPKGTEKARGAIFLQGFAEGERVEIEIWEVDRHDEYRKHRDEQIGAIEGVAQTAIKGIPRQVLTATSAKGTSSSMSPPATSSPQIIFEVDQLGTKAAYDFTPRSTKGEEDEGDSWEIQAFLAGDKSVRSSLYYVARTDHRVPTAHATYRWHEGHELTFYHDASTDASGSGGYFHDLLEAIGEAKHFIFVADWSFHPLMRPKPTSPPTIGARLRDWAKSNGSGLVAIHTWDHTNIAAKDPQNDDAEEIFTKDIGKPANLFWRASSRTGQDGGSGFGWSHHQKFVVLDCPCKGDSKGRRTIRAFVGGLDLTQGRFDWPDHPILDGDPGTAALLAVTNTKHGVHDWYSAEFGKNTPVNSAKTKVNTSSSDYHPRQPWHDIHCSVIGPSAWDVVREFVGRWNLDPSSSDAMGDDKDTHIQRVRDLFKKQLFDKKTFKPQWEPHKGDWTVQVLRSITRDHWGTDKAVVTPAKHKKSKSEFVWTINRSKKERSIQDSYIRSIRQAEKFIYLETQYFIGSGKKWLQDTRSGVANQLPEVLLDRCLEKARKKQEFHVYLLLPMFPEGDPSGSATQAQRDYQWSSLEYIIRGLQNDKSVPYWGNYLTVGFLAQWHNLPGSPITSGDRIKRVRENQRYMIYVHSKFMLIDDRFMIIGSANLNERSLAGGRDSEICVGIWPNLTKQDACASQAKSFRKALFTEHFGGLPTNWDTPEKLACAKDIQQRGADNFTLFTQGKHAAGGKTRKGHFCTWPIDGSKNGLGLRDQADLITDGLSGGSTGDDWYIWPTSYSGSGDIAE